MECCGSESTSCVTADCQRRRLGAVFPVGLRVSGRLLDARAADVPLRQSLWSDLMCSNGILLEVDSCCSPETFFWRLSVAQPQQQGATMDRQGGRNGIVGGVIASAVDVGVG